MLRSHEAPGQFTGPLRTKIKETRADPCGIPCGHARFFEEFWTRTGAVLYSPWLLSDTGFLRYFARRRHVCVRSRPARGPCGARSWPYGHHTKPVRAFRSAESKDPSCPLYTGPVLAPCGVSKSVRTPCGPVRFGGFGNSALAIGARRLEGPMTH